MSQKTKKNRKGLTADQVAAAAARYLSGETLVDIAPDFGYSASGMGLLLKRYGIVLRGRSCREGRKRPGWGGGSRVATTGYRLVLVYDDDPYRDTADGQGYAAEHRLIMARHLGRNLTSQETVHHINGDKLDNRIENLQLLRGVHATGVALCCADCGSTNLMEEEIKNAR